MKQCLTSRRFKCRTVDQWKRTALHSRAGLSDDQAWSQFIPVGCEVAQGVSMRVRLAWRRRKMWRFKGKWQVWGGRGVRCNPLVARRYGYLHPWPSTYETTLPGTYERLTGGRVE